METTSVVGRSRSDRIFALRVTLAYVAVCVVMVAGYRIYERLDIVENEVAYASERISAVENDVSDLNDRVEDLEADTQDDEDAVAMRFDTHPLRYRAN